MPIKKKILIGEDEAALARALELKLTKIGYEVSLASNGEMVLDMLEKDKYDALLLDLIMPKLDGFQVLEEIRNRGLSIHVAVSSNLGQEEDVKRAKDLGAMDYFIKSNTPINQIVERLQKIL